MSRRCAGCGRALRDPASIAAGLGPVCRRTLQPPAPQLPMAEPPLVATRPARARRLRAPVTTLPDITTYQPRSTPMPDQPPAYDLPQIAVACPPAPDGCGSPAGALCTSHSGTRQRKQDTHRARTAAWAANRPAAEEPTR
ncbi:DUF6011 domain-containing protein [Streptomyces diacarni]|uniref:DUF6011 domain-containing protein n=1 Tax=Streptomyces diacarni TaxID=2800381 RepID=UPI0033E4FC14